MKTKHQLLSTVFALLALAACVEEPKKNSNGHAESVSEQNAYEQRLSGFVLPDSIDASRVLATYYDAHAPGHGIIVNADTSKKTAYSFTFLADNSVQRDVLTQKSYNEFASVFGGTEYIVSQKHVTIIVERNGTSMTHEYERLDN